MRERDRLVTRVVDQVCVPVSIAGRPVGVIQHGMVSPHPMHGAACRCGAAVYDVPALDDAAQWMRTHLWTAHGIGLIEVDLRRLVPQQSASWERRAIEVVAQLAACWGDAGGTPLVARAA
jgi:hypothetical protein